MRGTQRAQITVSRFIMRHANLVPRALSLFPWLWVGPGDEVGGMQFEGSFQAINVGVTVGVRDSSPQNP